MFCNNCGAKLEAGVMFCAKCGARILPESEAVQEDDKTVILHEETGMQRKEQEAPLADTVESENLAAADAEGTEAAETSETSETAGAGEKAVETVETVEISPAGVVETGTAMVVPEMMEQKKFCPNCGTANGINDLFCQQCGMFFGNAEAKMGVGGTAAKKRKGGIWKRAALVAGLLVMIALGIVFVPRIIGGRGAEEQDFIMYVKDNELMMARRSKYEPVVIGDRLFDEKDELLNGIGVLSTKGFVYSPDCKYVYYPQKIGGGSCDLYRKRLDSKKAEAEKIDSKVTNYELIDKDKLIYTKDGKLYLYNKGEVEKLDSDVWMMQVSADGRHVLWRSDNKLYVQETKLKADKVKLDSDVGTIYGISENLDVIVYQKDDNLYVMKGMEEKEKIASDVYDAYAYDVNDSLKVYYLREGDQEDLSYYDLIEDDYLVQDQQMQEPRIEDYQRVTYKDSFWGVQEKWEVDDSYYEEVDKFQQKQNRDYLRTDLENYMISMAEWEIYYYDDASGDDEKIVTALMESGDTGGMVYGNLGTETALMYLGNTDLEKIRKPKLSDLAVMDYYEMQEQIADRLKEGRELLYLENGAVHEIEDFESESDYPNMWADEHNRVIYISDYTDGDGKLYQLAYGQKNASLELITDELKNVVSYNTDEVCYINEDGELYYGDELIAEDVYTAVIKEKESILYLTDMDKDGEEGTLNLYWNGESTEIADDAATNPKYYGHAGSLYGLCEMVGTDTVIFLSDYNFEKGRGDLNIYDGKKVKKIDTDVTWIIF